MLFRSSNGTASAGGTSHERSTEVDLERGEYPGLSAKTLDQHNASHRKNTTLDRIIVRIEVSDTGCGIKAKDIAKGKLFCRPCCLPTATITSAKVTMDFSGVQPDRTREVTRRERHWPWSCTCQADCLTHWWPAWCSVQGRCWVDLLG